MTALEPLARRLRRETADLHAEVELVADLPGSVRCREDYRRLLTSFENACSAISAGGPVETPWTGHWATRGIEPAGVGQLRLVQADLAALGGPPGRPAAGPATPPSVDEQLGRLYVLEGSALGRRVLAPLLVAKLGPIPVSFFLDGGRHPHGWRALQSALRSLDEDVDRHPEVVRGARAAFAVFTQHLRPRGLVPHRVAR